MGVLLKSLYLYSISLWVGSLFFFSAVGAPAAFRALPKEEAGKYTGTVFPKYFGLGYIFGLTALVSLYLLTKNTLTLLSSLVLLLLLLMNLLNVVNGLVIVPKASLLKAEFYRSKEESYYNKFLKLHRVSMVLNALTLILGLMAIGVTSLYLSL
ncbi:DUF4149 domain-containing protein [Phorcysia thermohydrogeniphila]|uniref:Uncharacterized protein DUF4149 n=1 Tax=Phorcysia thermohydrogeniphila TaxID=936138 RepID=A0A4R1GHV6_9BACT|nr:DUF4149 domain-containing protein [Phorcysia thermohydrogeniphila]TCK06691.1 uncharacterized protein DUF4149 [Phorcysia thermohydrogeniphila]